MIIINAFKYLMNKRRHIIGRAAVVKNFVILRHHLVCLSVKLEILRAQSFPLQL